MCHNIGVEKSGAKPDSSITWAITKWVIPIWQIDSNNTQDIRYIRIAAAFRLFELQMYSNRWKARVDFGNLGPSNQIKENDRLGFRPKTIHQKKGWCYGSLQLPQVNEGRAWEPLEGLNVREKFLHSVRFLNLTLLFYTTKILIESNFFVFNFLFKIIN